MQAIFIYVTIPKKDVALAISQRLLEKKMIACANIIPIASMYCWEGNVVQDEEVVMLLKTFSSMFQRVHDEIVALHPYRNPCITAVEVHPNESFLSWMRGEVAG